MASSLSHHSIYTHHLTSHYYLNTTYFPNSNLFNSNSLNRNPKIAAFRLRARALPESKESNSPVPPFLRLRNALKADELGREMLSIALPAALALAADPLTSLVDTAFVGHLGSVELAAVGVSASVFNLVSKLFNVPLFNITTSFVAEEQALISMPNEDSVQAPQENGKSRTALPSVSAALLLAAGLGLAEAVALSFGSGFLMNIMGFTNATAS